VTIKEGKVKNRNQSAAMSECEADRIRQNASAEVNAREQMERERYALKALRWDFEGVPSLSGEGGAAGAAWALEATGT
jgi:hypothetical protein